MNDMTASSKTSNPAVFAVYSSSNICPITITCYTEGQAHLRTSRLQKVSHELGKLCACCAWGSFGTSLQTQLGHRVNTLISVMSHEL
jgi:hypothetical protein